MQDARSCDGSGSDESALGLTSGTTQAVAKAVRNTFESTRAPVEEANTQTAFSDLRAECQSSCPVAGISAAWTLHETTPNDHVK